MGFIERELNRLAIALQDEPLDTERWKQLHAAQQALGWATEPQGYAAPLDTINRLGGRATGTPEAKADCSPRPHPAPS